MYTLITALASALLVGLFICGSRKIDIDKSLLILKIFAVGFCVLGIFRFFLADGFVETERDFSDPLQSFLRWGYHIGYVVVPLSIFLNSRLFKNIAAYFYLPMAILCSFFIKDTAQYFFSPEAGGLVFAPWLRYALYILELALAIAIPIAAQYHFKHKLDVKNRGEVLNFAIGLPLVLLTFMPAYLPQSTIGYTNLSAAAFSTMHISWIIFMIAAGVALYLVFSKKSFTERYNLCVFMALTELVHTMTVFFRGFELSRIPLQLCCTAGFFYVFALAFKNKKISNFCYLANTVGAIIAIALADFSSDALTFWNVHYMQEHALVLLLPILALSLGVFPKLDRSSIKDAVQVFGCYFVFCFVLGTLINGFDTGDGYPVNYFYMFNQTTAVNYLPFVGFTGAVHWEFGGFEIYPILVSMIYVIFNLLFIGFYFLTEGIYKLCDKIRASRPQAKISKQNIDIHA